MELVEGKIYFYLIHLDITLWIKYGDQCNWMFFRYWAVDPDDVNGGYITASTEFPCGTCLEVSETEKFSLYYETLTWGFLLFRCIYRIFLHCHVSGQEQRHWSEHKCPGGGLWRHQGPRPQPAGMIKMGLIDWMWDYREISKLGFTGRGFQGIALVWACSSIWGQNCGLTCFCWQGDFFQLLEMNSYATPSQCNALMLLVGISIPMC